MPQFWNEQFQYQDTDSLEPEGCNRDVGVGKKSSLRLPFNSGVESVCQLRQGEVTHIIIN